MAEIAPGEAFCPHCGVLLEGGTIRVEGHNADEVRDVALALAERQAALRHSTAVGGTAGGGVERQAKSRSVAAVVGILLTLVVFVGCEAVKPRLATNAADAIEGVLVGIALFGLPGLFLFDFRPRREDQTGRLGVLAAALLGIGGIVLAVVSLASSSGETKDTLIRLAAPTCLAPALVTLALLASKELDP
jgi:peptidoglycan/LPS O-acetylase OafA/YrhL